MELWNLKEGKGTFWHNGKNCLALRQRGTEETGTRLYELVAEKTDKRGLPLKILRELTLDEAKKQATKVTKHFDVESKKTYRNYYYDASWGKEKFLSEEIEDDHFLKDLIEMVKEAGTFKKTFRQTRESGIDFAGKNYINLEIEYEVDVVEGKISSWKIISEKWWRGFRRYVGTKVTGYIESPDGRSDAETTEVFIEGSSDEPIPEGEKKELREIEIWHIEERLPDIANSLSDVPGLYRPKGEGYKKTLKALTEAFNRRG